MTQDSKPGETGREDIERAPGDKPKLPGNHGQFGVDDETEDYRPMPGGKPEAGRGGGTPGDQGPSQTNAGDRS